MNRRGGLGIWPALTGMLLGAAGLYGYLDWKNKDQISIDWGHFEDYVYFLEEEGEIEPPEPFKAQPLEVRAFAEVRALPDIAVITASLTAKDKDESFTINDIAKRVNKVQTAIARFDVDVSVTDTKTVRKYNPLCRSENREARTRHSQINSDYWFNKRLDDKGDQDTKRRDPRPRIAQKICNAEAIEARTSLVIRVSPPDAAGDVLQALADAGADSTRLYGYDFSNYDALYQDAAAKAVSKARMKAEMIARHSKAELGEILEFYVGRPARTGRFGPQPTIINKSSARGNEYEGIAPAPPLVSAAPATYRNWDGTESNGYDEIIVTGARLVTSRGGRNPNKQADVDNASEEDTIPTTQNNALQMSLFSGPKTIRVSAHLSYDYKTVIDGSVVPEDDN